MKRCSTKPSLRARRLAATGVPWRAPVAADRNGLLGWVVNSFAYGDYGLAPLGWNDPALLRTRPLSCRCCVEGVFRDQDAATAFLARWPDEVAVVERKWREHTERHGLSAAGTTPPTT